MSDSRKWLTLAFLVLAQFMIVLDVSILNVALPSIERTLGLSVSGLQWLVTAYTLAFGGFLLLGGRAADLYGRRRVFVAGVIGFTLVSLSIGLSHSAGLMVPLRALQGFFAAFMSPAALSLVLTLFHDQTRRTRALSIWGAVSAGGATVGLLLGGFLTQYLSWRWNFFINVPVGLIVIIAAMRLIPAHIDEEGDKHLDLLGAVLATGGLMLLVYTLSNANAWGWSSLATIGSLVVSVALIAGFLFNEWLTKHPLMPLSIFRIGNVAAANAMQFPITASLFSAFFFLTLYVQNVLGFTPFQAGLAFLPMSLLIGTSAVLAPKFIRRFGYKRILVAAPLFPALGLFLLGGVPVDGTYLANVLPAILIMPIGLGLSFVGISVAATSGIPPRESGLASGILTTAQQIGGSLGLAVLASVAAATTVTASLSDTPATALVDGFHAAFYTGSAFAVLASLVALIFIRPIPAAASAEPVAHAG